MTTSRRPREPMPDFVSTALEESGLRRKYDNRPPYQRNDYLRWINGAKKAETKRKRLAIMLEELAAGSVYMRMPWKVRPQ
mgnify:CR=1 FL=1